MFDRESGDMLPRPAPKPCTPPNEDMFKPAVPEVSILFDKKNEKQQQHGENAKQDKSPKVQSYAAWKKQQLPQVVYPLSERENFHQNELGINELLYPMRAPMPINHMIPPHMPNYYDNTAHYFNHVSPVNRPTTAPVTTYHQQVVYPAHRRSLDAVSSTLNNNNNNNNDMYQYASPHLLAAVKSKYEVLTLCASTQTDAATTEAPLSPQDLRQFATKSDVDRLMETVQQIRNDQIRVMYMLENLIVQQKQQQPEQINTRTQTTEAGTQYEQKTACEEVNMSPKPAQNGTATQAARFHTPRLPPAAQSTAYQGNTPPGILRRSASGQPAKPPTDKTMTMNELALKYLPDDKLHELMNDMQLAGPRNPVMERVMIASKAPTDLSNASYKYLKKYRLLPEEENVTTKAMRFYDEDTRHSHPNSPYEPRPVDSPIILRRAASEGVNVNADRSDFINLDDLRNKPKFM